MAGPRACSEQTVTPAASDELLEIGADNVVFGMVSFMTSRGIREGRVEACRQQYPSLKRSVLSLHEALRSFVTFSATTSTFANVISKSRV